MAKDSSWPVTGLWNRGPLKILNGIILIQDDQGITWTHVYNQSEIIQVLQRSLIPQTSNWLGTIFCRFLQQTGSRPQTKFTCTYRKHFNILKWFLFLMKGCNMFLHGLTSKKRSFCYTFHFKLFFSSWTDSKTSLLNQDRFDCFLRLMDYKRMMFKSVTLYGRNQNPNIRKIIF